MIRPRPPMVRAAVVGHVEWIEFLRVEQLPAPGEIIKASETWQEPGGGGAVAAGQLARLAGECSFFTALGDDELGHRALQELTALGVQVEAAFRPVPQRRGITFVDSAGERTITILGKRLWPSARDPLPWDQLAGADAVYITAGDKAAMKLARRGKVVVATSRILPEIAEAAIEIDALVGSVRDPSEAYRSGDLFPEPKLVVRTNGALGGTYQLPGEEPETYSAEVRQGQISDTYGAGDSFAAGLAYALGAGHSPKDSVEFASRCGAAATTGRGPFAGQLS